MGLRFSTALLLIALCAPLHAAAGQQKWSIPFALVAPPGVRADGSVVAQSADTLMLVSADGTVRWRVAVRATTSNSVQPPMIDDSGNTVVLTSTGVSSYDAAGIQRWSLPLTFASIYTSLALGQKGEVVVKSGNDWYVLDGSGQVLWSTPQNVGGGVTPVTGPFYTASPAIVGPDGNVRSVISDDTVIVHSTNGAVVTSDSTGGGDPSMFGFAALIGVGPSGENLVVSRRQPPPLSSDVSYLVTPSAGNFRVRWTTATGIGQTWSNAFVLGNPNDPIGSSEALRYGLCGPSGEVLVVTSLGTVIMPHDGIGSRRWADAAFAIGDQGDFLGSDGSHLVLRHADQSVAWSVPAEGTYFTLAPNGIAYGGSQSLSAYDTGIMPAAGPWAQPRGDAFQRARMPAKFGPFTPNAADSIVCSSTASLYDTYSGQVNASPYVQGPATLTWEKDGADVGPAADDYSLVVALASPSSAGKYRLRANTSRTTVRSVEIAVNVVEPSAILPGLYWGKLPAPKSALFCLEIKPDRTVRYLTSDGDHYTPGMHVRLDPTGGYPWTIGIPQYQMGAALQATVTGVSVSWQNGAAQPAAPAAAALPSGARTGWYDGNFVGPLNDDCAAELALLPDGTLIGPIRATSSGLNTPMTLDPTLLTQTIVFSDILHPPRLADRLTITFNPAGRVKFELLSYPYAPLNSHVWEAFASGAAPDTQLVNFSVRGHAGANAGMIVAGFVVAAPGQFLVRGVGPTLADFAVDSPLPTPALRLTLPNGNLISQNQGWSTLDAAGIAAIRAAATATSAFQLRTGSADSALIASLDAGLYTAQLSSADDGSALEEIYAMPPQGTQSPARLINLSARGVLSAANPMLTVGFVHVTDSSRRILIRGVGPGLKPFVGNAAVCQNPRIRVFDAARTLVAANNDWGRFGTDPYPQGTSQVNTVTDPATASGAFPLTYDSQDAALVLNLPGGQYTVQLDSEDGKGGEVLFEVYAVP